MAKRPPKPPKLPDEKMIPLREAIAAVEELQERIGELEDQLVMVEEEDEEPDWDRYWESGLARGLRRKGERVSCGEWQKLRLALEAAGGGIEWRKETERTVEAGHQTIIRYRFPDGRTAWRYATEAKLRREKAPIDLEVA
jgi:hypothetical protein